MRAEGHRTRLNTAFSRDQNDKIYVQDKMLQNAKEFWRWLQDGASVYVCGDASHMANDVRAAICKIVEAEGGKSPEQAQE